MKLIIKDNLFTKVLFFLLGLSFCVFKGGLYIFPLLIFIVFFWSKPGFFFRNNEFKSIIILSLVTFVIGLSSLLIVNEYSHDILFFLKKSIFLFLIPILFYYFKDKSIRYYLLYGFFIGVIVANLYAYSVFYRSGVSLAHADAHSFWDVGRWREILCYTVCICIPFLFYTNIKIKLAALSLIVLCIPSIIFSGGRIEYVAISLTLIVYMLAFQRKRIIYLIALISALCSIFYFHPTQVSKTVINKVDSILNTKSNDSNLARLTMYTEGIKFIQYNYEHTPKLFVFGMGESGFHHHFIDYLNKTNNLQALMQQTNNQISTSDQHNAYLNTLSKRGLLYFLSFYMMMLIILYKSYESAKTNNPYLQASFMLIACYLIIGMLYSNAFSFQTIIVFSLWCLLSSFVYDKDREVIV